MIRVYLNRRDKVREVILNADRHERLAIEPQAAAVIEALGKVEIALNMTRVAMHSLDAVALPGAIDVTAAALYELARARQRLSEQLRELSA